MTTQTSTNGSAINGHDENVKSILTVSMAKYLMGHDITEVIEQDWSDGNKATPQQRRAFDNQGFNLDPTDVEVTLAGLKERLQDKKWDGVIVGWCTRGNKKYTPLFESVVNMIVDEVVRRATTPKMEQQEEDKGLKLMFCDGPDDLVNATLRSFGEEDKD